MRKFLLLLLLALFALSGGAEAKTSAAFRAPDWTFRDKVAHTITDHGGWGISQLADPTRATFMGTGSPSRFPNSTVEWTIQAGDYGAGAPYNRDEFADMYGTTQRDAVAGETEYCAFSVYIPSGWVDTHGAYNWFIIFQHHGNDSNVSPFNQANVQFLLSSYFNQSTPNRYTLRTDGGIREEPTSLSTSSTSDPTNTTSGLILSSSSIGRLIALDPLTS